MIVKDSYESFNEKIPPLSNEFRKEFAPRILECVMAEAKDYPPQMQNLVVSNGVENFISGYVAVMTADILYSDGTFKPLTENEKITSNLIMFSDILP